jgi:hypothetical protein
MKKLELNLTDRQYDILKWGAQYLLPGLSALYLAVAKIWGFPYTVEVAGTLAAINAFLGVLLGIATSTYVRNNPIKTISFVFESVVYDTFKWISQYLLPAAATLYFALSVIWNWPHAERIVGSIAAINAFLSLMLGLSGIHYTTKKLD